MNDYVYFEAEHIEDVCHDDPDQASAVSYGDIDAYPVGEDSQGIVACRVWLLHGKNNGMYRYLVDWHCDTYMKDPEARKRVQEMKERLITRREAAIGQLFERTYQKYILCWMLDHGCSLSRLLTGIQDVLNDGASDMDEAFSQFVGDVGFDGSIWACRDEFRESEWQDCDLMRDMLSPEDFALWKERQ